MEKKCEKHKKGNKVLVCHPTVCNDDSPIQRKQSTETLNRLKMVSQRLQQEVEQRYWSEMYGSRILFILRIGSMVLMILIIVLIITGKGSISLNNDEKETIFIWLSFEKWLSIQNKELPKEFNDINIRWQYLCVFCILIILILQIYYTYLHLKKVEHCFRACKLIHFINCFMLFFLFFIEGLFSFCPWVETSFQNGRIVYEIPNDNFFKITSCSISGWFLAAQLLLATSLIMCFEFFIILNIGSTDVHRNDRRYVNIQIQGSTV
uniref:Transmembrane protein n=1 Tax=Strongyloides venezuelensis TaxID=75913 RepID=A0A0K0EUY2_STRVS